MNTMPGLEVTLQSDREFAMTRTFDAPRELVFEAYTRPELLRRWLGVFGGWSFAVCEVDLRVGGAYRYVWRHTDGMEMGMGGTFQEIVRPERIVSTEKFDHAWYEGNCVDTLTLTESAGRTTLTIRMLYDSKAIRDSVLASPMKSGMEAGFNALAAVLAPRPASKSLGRSIGAIALGFFAVALLSLGTDQVLHLLGVYPPWGVPMYDPMLNLLALAYRCVYTVAGGFLTARFAPDRPMRHVWITAGIGTFFGVMGVVAGMTHDLGPIWYPILIVVTAIPCLWLGGRLFTRGVGR